MNDIELRVREHHIRQTPEVSVWIDGRALAELAYEAQEAYAVAHGDPTGGAWWGGAVEAAHWAGLLAYGRGTVVAACECGYAGCGAVTARIEATTPVVTWTFPPVGPAGATSGLGPFVFDRAEYEAAVRSVVEPLLAQEA